MVEDWFISVIKQVHCSPIGIWLRIINPMTLQANIILVKRWLNWYTEINMLYVSYKNTWALLGNVLLQGAFTYS